MLRLAVTLALLFAAAQAFATEAGWALLREGGHVVLLTHANAPGVGDPANFELDNCRTQRNLSDRGRVQARRMGPLFLARAAPVERVLSSRWCRAMDTARIAFGEDAEPFEALDPVPAGDEMTAERRAAIIEEVSSFSGSGNLVMVTHPETVKALTGTRPREAEALIVVPADGALHVAGRIVFN